MIHWANPILQLAARLQSLRLFVLPVDQYLQSTRDEPGHEYAEVLLCRGDVLLPQSGSLGSLRRRIL